MNLDVFEGKWKQLRGQSHEWWGKLTDNDLDQVYGQYENLVGVIQEKYGYTHEKAEAEVNKRVAEHEAHQKKRAVAMR